ncbi:hypothetical protein MSSIT_3133 [Methanosarcina siciliae T4/M]|uniref:DUF5305 domain-containing protein n=1 Tax=Methanosarcina siciliae T4/M TaxID=1434120 RepID=A0A0E3P7J7_9EURY|nr:DUF5305 domain-containing protein [Methanosarcina siciliae]AKB29852.1 hypothetical protein MSSIT_3133 [Methanosarcina siciliae T4/M]
MLTVVFLLIMVFSGLWIYEKYTETSYEQEEVLSYTQYGTYTYSASVTEPNPLYPEGTRLEMGKAAYFFAVSPTLDVSFIYSFEAADSADLDVEAETMIVASGKEGSGEEQKIFWQKKFSVGDPITVKMENGDIFIYNFTLDMPETKLMAKKVQYQLNYSSDLAIEIVTTVDYEGKINGQKVKGTKNFAMPINIVSTYYQVPAELGSREDTYKNIRVKRDPSLSMIKFPLFLFFLNAILIGALIPIGKMKKIDTEYIEKIEKERKKAPFKEFISKGKIPENLNSLLQVEISSLKDLVDVASDINERVIHDTASGEYFIIHNGTLYIFFEDPSEEEY